MIIGTHIRASRPRHTRDVDRTVLAAMRPADAATAVASAIGDIRMIRRNKKTMRLEISALRDRGLTQEAISKVCSRNWLRASRAVRA